MKSKNALKHIAFILDGNGRWAKSKGMPRNYGHKVGSNVASKVYDWCLEYNIKYVTMYIFSTENWKRPDEEVNYIIDLAYKEVENYKKDFMKKNIRFRHIGSKEMLDEKMNRLINELEDLTKDNSALTVVAAISYGGRDEITRMVKNVANDIKKEKIDIPQINEKLVDNYLDTKGMPDVDVLVRTSDVRRLSGFLPWQSVYAEIFFLEKMWPDFKKNDFKKILEEYGHIERRFGNIYEEESLNEKN